MIQGVEKQGDPHERENGTKKSAQVIVHLPLYRDSPASQLSKFYRKLIWSNHRFSMTNQRKFYFQKQDFLSEYMKGKNHLIVLGDQKKVGLHQTQLLCSIGVKYSQGLNTVAFG